MSDSQAAMTKAVITGFRRTFGDSHGLTVAMAPGRVNLIGEYTDFNDGFVLPMTVDRGLYLAVRARADNMVRVASMRYDELVEYEFDQFEMPKPGSWQSYVLGVVQELRLRGHLTHGFDAVVDGDLSLGAGLSSSAALEVATAVALQEVAGFDMTRVDLVTMCQHVEHTYANVLCGIMDQFACGMGRSGQALLLDCRSLEYENVPMDLGEYQVVIISSEVQRSLTSSAYNTRRAECQEGVEHFANIDPSIRALRDVNQRLFQSHGDELRPGVRRRCRHVIAENQRTLDAASALKARSLDEFGGLMTDSHRSLSCEFEVSCPELDMLVKLANNTEGVLGSRMTGAGFGGCTVSIVHEDAVDTLVETVQREYSRRFNLSPKAFVVERNLAASIVSSSALRL